MRPTAVVSSLLAPLFPGQSPGFLASTGLNLTPLNGTNSEQELEVHVYR